MMLMGRLAIGRVIQVAAVSALLTGCWDNNTTKLQWMPDMADTAVVKPQRDYIDPPEGSIAVDSMEYPKTVEEGESSLINPVTPSAETVAKGKKLYDTFCAVCHGLGGKGDGTLKGLFPQPPDITHPSYGARKDGFFFYRISFGTAVMPAYGHSITREERWIIVHYLRALQQKGA